MEICDLVYESLLDFAHVRAYRWRYRGGSLQHLGQAQEPSHDP
jgi:hypothetical protein